MAENKVMERGRFPYYAVRRGRQVGIYTTWEDCNEQVLGYSHAEFKGFHVHDEAAAWISRGKVKAASWGKQNSGGGVRCQIGGNTPLPSLAVSARGLDDEGCSSKARGGSGDGRGVVTVRAEHPFLLVEDMEMMLMRACLMLRIGCPIFLSQETKPLDGVYRFGFTVVLPSNDSSLELVAHGPVSVNHHDARQEASFVMLEKLISATGLAICDYNYCIICRLKHERNEENTKIVTSMSERICHLEEENAILKRQVEMFAELVEE